MEVSSSREYAVMPVSAMSTADATPAYETVAAIVSRSGWSRPVSVRQTIAAYRAASPGSSLSDEELVRLIVRAATGRTSAVHFDGTGVERTAQLG